MSEKRERKTYGKNKRRRRIRYNNNNNENNHLNNKQLIDISQVS